MLSRTAVTLLFLSPALLFGQLSNNAVTVAASQTAASIADQAVFVLSVQSGVGTSLDAVVAALASTGITAANLTGFSAPTTPIFAVTGQLPSPSPSQLATMLVWNFQLTAPLSKVTQAVATLTGLEQKLQQNQSGLSLSFSLVGNRASAPAACNLADLISAARAQAQTIASAAGLTAGALLAMTTQSGSPACSLTARFALGLLFPPADQHTITIAASRSTTLQPDQAIIALIVSSRLTSTQDDVTAALAQAGISGATFTGVNSTPVGPTGVVGGIGITAVQPLLEWSYQLATPVAKASDTIALLLAAQQSLAKSNAGFGLTFNVQGLQVSQALQNSQICSESGLVSDAKATAQTLAAAAGVSVGPILSMGSGGSPSGFATGLTPTLGLVGFNGVATLSSFLLGSPATNNCSLTVQYQMLP